MDHIALTVCDVLGSKHLELCTGENAVAASAESISRIAGVFIRIALVELQLYQHRLVGRRQLRGFIGMDGSVQKDLFKHISFGCAALLYGVLPLAQRFRHSHAVCIRNHRGGKTLTVLVCVVNIEYHASNGIAVFTVRLGQAQPALGGLVLHVDFVGTEVFFVDDHLRGEVIVHEMRRNLGFSHLVHAIREQRRHGDAVGVRCDDCDHFTVTLAVVGRQTADARDGELCTRQGFAGQLIQLADTEDTLDGFVGNRKLGGFIRVDDGGQLCQIVNIADRFIFFLHQIPALAKRRRNSDAVLIRGHGAGKAGTVIIVVVHVESDTCDGMTVQAVSFGQLQPAFGGLVLYDHLISLQVVIRNGDVHRKTVVHKMFRDNGFFDLVGAVSQQRRFSHTVSIRGYDSDHLSVTCTFMSGDAAEPGDGEFRTRQQIAGQLIFLHDANLALDRVVGHSQIGGFIRMYHCRQLCQRSHITNRILMLADGVASFGKCWGNCKAALIRGHGANQITGGIENVELYTGNGHSVQAVRFGQANVTLGRHIAHLKGVGHAILIGGNSF